MIDVTLKNRIVLFALLLAPCLSLAQSPVKATAQKLEAPVQATAQTLDSSAQSLGHSLAHALTVQPPFDPATYKPLNAHERWQRWISEDGRSPAIHVESLATAFYQQTFDVPAAWTRSGGGLARRLGSSYGSNLIQNSAHESMAGIAGTDPRYFPCACTGLFRRGGHVFKMSFLTYTNSGHLTLDLPQITSIYGSSMAEAAWWPEHYSPLVQGVQAGHIEAGFIGAEHLVQEFAPELKRFFHLRW
jgi:hypothetical protein